MRDRTHAAFGKVITAIWDNRGCEFSTKDIGVLLDMYDSFVNNRMRIIEEILPNFLSRRRDPSYAPVKYLWKVNTNGFSGPQDVFNRVVKNLDYSVIRKADQKGKNKAKGKERIKKAVEKEKKKKEYVLHDIERQSFFLESKNKDKDNKEQETVITVNYPDHCVKEPIHPLYHSKEYVEESKVEQPKLHVEAVDLPPIPEKIDYQAIIKETISQMCGFVWSAKPLVIRHIHTHRTIK